MNTVPQLLSALGTFAGVADLALNDDQVCRLVLDKKMVIDIEHLADTNTLHVYAAVGNLPVDNAALCQQLLAANLFGQGTGGAVLALDEQRHEVLLFRSFDVDSTTSEVFVAAVDSLAVHAEAWINVLLEADDEDDERVSDDTSSSGENFIRV